MPPARKRHGAVDKKQSSALRVAYEDEIRTLKTDAGSMRGRDASVIKADVVALKERIKADTALSAMQRKVLLKAAQEVFDDYSLISDMLIGLC